MSIGKMKVEGGQGGKRGHSNMNHWTTTEEIKKVSKRLRRIQAKKQIQKQMDDLIHETKDYSN